MWCVCVSLKLQLMCYGDTYTRGLILSEHTPSLIVEVMFIGGMLCLTEAIDKVGCESSRHLDEHV